MADLSGVKVGDVLRVRSMRYPGISSLAVVTGVSHLHIHTNDSRVFGRFSGRGIDHIAEREATNENA